MLDLANRYDRGSTVVGSHPFPMDSRPLPDPSEPLPEPVARQFLSLMSNPARLSELLRRLHELRALEQIVPGMWHTRGLLQFNAYHHYTVDEHSLRAVQCVAKLASDPGLAGDVYRNLKPKGILHLAVLIHDLGKGSSRNHSEVGSEMAGQLGHRLRLGSGRSTSSNSGLKHCGRAISSTTSDENVVVVRRGRLGGKLANALPADARRSGGGWAGRPQRGHASPICSTH